MSKQPNVIYIFGDDRRHDYLGCAGHPVLRTPHLDRLAAEGGMDFLQPNPGFRKRATHPLAERPVDKPFCLCVTFNLPHGASTGTMQLRPQDDELYRSTDRDVQHRLRPPATIPFAAGAETF